MMSCVTESESLGVAGSAESSKFVMTENSWNNCLLSKRLN